VLATSPNVLYLVDMRKASQWGCAVVGSLVICLGLPLSAHAQPQPTAPPPPAANPGGWIGPEQAAPAGSTDAPVPTEVSTAAPPRAPAAQAPAPKPPTIDLHSDPPPPPPVKRTDRTHDGFYARLNLGFGNLGTTMNSPDSGAVKGSGSTLALDLALGYAVSPGIVLGGTLLMEHLPSAELSATRPVVSDVGAGMVGPFFDGYPNAREGFHLGGGLGLASARVQREEAAGFKKAAGFGIAGWVGYDVWVADQWSAGVLVRLMGTRTKADAVATENNLAGSATMATQSIALMLTGVYN
jgi:hypothetical protein